MVCLGNICRSPSAEGVLRIALGKRGLADKVGVDSAGTAAWHVGNSPDPRSVAHAKKRAVDITSCRARQVASDDFHVFDYVLAMDKSNLHALKQLQPANSKARLDLLLSFGSLPGFDQVPDPYYGEQDGFDMVLDLIEAGVSGLIDHIVAHDLRLPQ
ncbi:low molecular weight protein-tyrosine-phosphatase [Simiduia litorea]|uniref:low molecular weight protein-tyrosine-phosphatase n=1 Tax=Simiduia litorea TaxID=1435348 RepID=UPI0036F1E72E